MEEEEQQQQQEQEQEQEHPPQPLQQQQPDPQQQQQQHGSSGAPALLAGTPCVPLPRGSQPQATPACFPLGLAAASTQQRPGGRPPLGDRTNTAAPPQRQQSSAAQPGPGRPPAASAGTAQENIPPTLPTVGCQCTAAPPRSCLYCIACQCLRGGSAVRTGRLTHH